MKQLIIYNLELGIIMLCFYIIYTLFYKKSTDFKFNRFYINSSVILSILIPFTPVFKLTQTKVFQGLLDTVTIGGNAIKPNHIYNTGNGFNLNTIVITGYSLITATLVAIVFFNFFKIIRLIKSNKISNYKNFKIIKDKSVVAPYSFFKYIFLPSSIVYQKEALDIVLKHESMHAKLGHSFDKVLLLIVKCAIWWNPISYFFLKELSLIHEYEVDTHITKTHCKKKYGEFLVQQIIHTNKYNFVNPISSTTDSD